MTTILTLDFETTSSADLKEVGAYRYWRDPTTEITCLCWATSDGEHDEWRPDDTVLYRQALTPDVIFEAHNAAFEIEGWRQHMVGLYGLPDVPNHRWRCTMAAAAQRAIPLKLEHGLAWLDVGMGKDKEGSRLAVAMSKPKRGQYDRSAETIARVTAYCHSDVRNEQALAAVVGPLPDAEQTVWLMDLEINQRGVRLDVPFVRAAQTLVRRTLEPMIAEFGRITGGLEITQTARILAWAKEQGAALPNLQKATLQAAIGGLLFEDAEEGDDDEVLLDPIEIPEHVKHALRLRSVGGSASVKKYDAMLASVCEDGRARGLLQYHAASTGRWGGRLWQPQNLPRPVVKMDPEALVAAVMTEDPEHVRQFGDPIEVALSGCRQAIVAAPGKALVVGDFASIEARVVLALAGQHDKCDLLASGADVYSDVASLIFERPIDRKQEPVEGQIGKNTVLGCGFQMGWRKFQARYAADRDDDFCRKVIDTYRREWAPQVPALWADLETAALTAVWEKRPVTAACGVTYTPGRWWLRAVLPSGRSLWYFNAQAGFTTLPWAPEERVRAWSYQAQKLGQKRTIWAYGGLLTENVVQALARDLLVDAMQQTQAHGWPIVLTVHDEIIAEVPEAQADAETLRQIMSSPPAWARAIKVPVAAECWTGTRYHK